MTEKFKIICRKCGSKNVETSMDGNSCPSCYFEKCTIKCEDCGTFEEIY